VALTDRQCRQATPPAVLIDGDGLRLKVSATPSGGVSKRWVLRYTLVDGRRREAGLGAFPKTTLSEAREKAAELRKQAKAGTDPLAERERAEQEKRQEAAPVTFRQCAENFIGAHEGSWGNAKHRQQWANTLQTYVHPAFGDLPVSEIAEPQVLAVLGPIWLAKPETARRVRQRIESVLDYARVCGLRPFEARNPATFKGNLQFALPKHPRTKAHHAALPWAESPAFWQALQTRTGAGVDCLCFAILTAARSGEARGARWGEIDLTEGVWTIPGERMKAKKPHRVPLSEAALTILNKRRGMAGDPGAGVLVFPSDMRPGAALSDMTLTSVLKRLGRGDLTQHGFRSTFRDWAAEHTSFPREVAEQALAHAIGNAVEAAYRRGDLFEKRRRLMDDWARYVTTPAAEDGDNVRLLRRAVDD
jgi:integrase